MGGAGSCGTEKARATNPPACASSHPPTHPPPACPPVPCSPLPRPTAPSAPQTAASCPAQGDGASREAGLWHQAPGLGVAALQWPAAAEQQHCLLSCRHPQQPLLPSQAELPRGRWTAYALPTHHSPYPTCRMPPCARSLSSYAASRSRTSSCSTAPPREQRCKHGKWLKQYRASSCSHPQGVTPVGNLRNLACLPPLACAVPPTPRPALNQHSRRVNVQQYDK